MRLSGLRILAIVTLSLTVTAAWAHGPAMRAPSIDQLDAAALAPVVAASPTAIAPPASRGELVTVKPPAAPSVPGTVETIAVLLVALGLAGLARSWRRDRRSALAVASAALLLGFVVETTPHLVHHSLEPDQGANCEVLQTAERSQAAVVGLHAAPVSAPAYLDDRSPDVLAPTLSAPAPRGRAPPA